ncbi:site-specific DNA-methyltransferase [Mycolicibacterium holsaticum]|uniref:site-specific DNA-methyltransferase n=1 Tax=Mycolicibacterium holsaticum TaxID=152142 RepID=UPI001C7CD54C|nr:site-specific DNA-methyltransferase [Mycolicibacterium holsaticum]QZA11906.1 site-specific DNA-methyltransferase [Mycolicibacterium holsaticum DSM 44478 = JCM 12374]UNC10606.1 hypothetical protein H5U41_04280 [Mycolicibacterium holsaticum DSM 44478 = JCM 12374]
MNGLPWRGQFTPDLVDELLTTYAKPGLVIDPFCGSGTALIEAAHKGFASTGIEVNPAAVILARLHTLVGIEWSERHRAALDAYAALSKVATAASEVIAKTASSLPDLDVRLIAEALFLLTLGNSKEFSASGLDRAASKIDALLATQPDRGVTIDVRLGDARALGLADNSATTALTSPPYVNVFNYHQNYRAAVELLGWEVLPAARAEFGSNRKHRQNRFLTIIQYAQDLGLALAELNRVMRPGGLSIWVIGRESKVLGESVTNPAILHAMAVGVCDVELLRKHERRFTSRFGTLVYEDILIYRHGGGVEHVHESEIAKYGSRIGRQVLEALRSDRKDARWELSSAIDVAESVKPSPVPEFNNPAIP